MHMRIYDFVGQYTPSDFHRLLDLEKLEVALQTGLNWVKSIEVNAEIMGHGETTGAHWWEPKAIKLKVDPFESQHAGGVAVHEMMHAAMQSQGLGSGGPEEGLKGIGRQERVAYYMDRVIGQAFPALQAFEGAVIGYGNARTAEEKGRWAREAGTQWAAAKAALEAPYKWRTYLFGLVEAEVKPDAELMKDIATYLNIKSDLLNGKKLEAAYAASSGEYDRMFDDDEFHAGVRAATQKK
jgi:hypothetical protein